MTDYFSGLTGHPSLTTGILLLAGGALALGFLLRTRHNLRRLDHHEAADRMEPRSGLGFRWEFGGEGGCSGGDGGGGGGD